MTELIHDELLFPYAAAVAATPGDAKRIGPGAVCEREDGTKTVATYRVVVEADSFGCEYVYMDDAMYREYCEQREAMLNTLECERCGSTDNVKERRDPEEGNSGPLYDMCGKCYQNILNALYGD